MMAICKKALKIIKLFVLFWTRIVFVRNHFKVSFINKLRANFAGGFTADQFVLYDLKHSSKAEYLSEFDWYRSRYINEPFDFAFNNKVVCSEILKHHIRTPENYFIKIKGFVRDFKDGIRDNGAVKDCLKEKKSLFMKPYNSGKGKGVHILEYRDGCFFIDKAECDERKFDSFLNKNQDFIVCECMKQHEYASRLYDLTVNTIRIITLRDTRTHEFKIYFAVQRIGRKQSIPVDNASRGALVSKIDIETGVLSEARSLHDLGVYPVHPDSGAQIEGIRIPGWKEIKTEILSVCRNIPYMEFIAWDLILTDEGICMIEANTSSGINILQLWGGQRKGELGDFFRYYGAIKN